VFSISHYTSAFCGVYHEIYRSRIQNLIFFQSLSSKYKNKPTTTPSIKQTSTKHETSSIEKIKVPDPETSATTELQQLLASETTTEAKSSQITQEQTTDSSTTPTPSTTTATSTSTTTTTTTTTTTVYTLRFF